MLLLITDTSPVCHILWNNKDSLLGIKLSASSAQLLTKRLITHESDEMSKKMRSLFGQSLFGQSLSRDDLRVICAAVVNDHNKLRDFAEILLLSSNTSSLAIDLLKKYCKYRV